MGGARLGDGGEELKSRCRSTHCVGNRDSRCPRNNDPFLRECIYKAGWRRPWPSTQPISGVPSCRLPAPDLPITLARVSQPSSTIIKEGGGRPCGFWRPEGEKGKGANLLAPGLPGLCSTLRLEAWERECCPTPGGQREARCFLLPPAPSRVAPTPVPAPETGVNSTGGGDVNGDAGPVGCSLRQEVIPLTGGWTPLGLALA